MDLRYVLPPTGSTVRDIERNRYGQVIARNGRSCQVRFLNGEVRTVFVSNLEIVRRVRTLY